MVARKEGRKEERKGCRIPRDFISLNTCDVGRWSRARFGGPTSRQGVGGGGVVGGKGELKIYDGW